MKRAIIYTRVSGDKTREARSPEEQENDCRAECDRNGWPVAQVVTDNDMSASRWAARERPGFKRLWSILQPGDVLVTWESSRAQRDLRDYLDLRDLCYERGVLLSYSGRVYDLSEGEDRFTTGLDALIAERYAEETRKRVMRSQQANLKAGKPHGRIAYGYMAVRDDHGKILDRVPDPHTSAIIREAYDRVLAGDLLYRISEDFNTRAVPGYRSSSRWTPTSLRYLLLKPTYAGLRTHKGEITGRGTWQPLISLEAYEAVRKILTDPARRTNSGTKPKYLLSGIARCGVCNAHVDRQKSKHGDVYSCSAPPRHVQRPLRAVDEFATEYLLELLSDPRMKKALSGTEVVDDAYGEIAHLNERLEGFIMAAAEGKISAEAFAKIENQLNAKIAAEREKAASAEIDPLLSALMNGDASAVWEGFSLEQQRMVARAGLVVTINPVGRGRRNYDIRASLDLDWRH